MTIVPDTVVDDAVYCCSVHKEMPSIAIKGDVSLVLLGIKVLHYCPVSGCESFQPHDGMETWDNLYTRFGINPLPYVVSTQVQRVLQQLFRHIFLLTVRVMILTDKEKRRTNLKQ